MYLEIIGTCDILHHSKEREKTKIHSVAEIRAIRVYSLGVGNGNVQALHMDDHFGNHNHNLIMRISDIEPLNIK